jgi:hypothetical protein
MSEECPRVIVSCHAFTRVIGGFEADVHFVMLKKADQRLCLAALRCGTCDDAAARPGDQELRSRAGGLGVKAVLCSVLKINLIVSCFCPKQWLGIGSTMEPVLSLCALCMCRAPVGLMGLPSHRAPIQTVEPAKGLSHTCSTHMPFEAADM